MTQVVASIAVAAACLGPAAYTSATRLPAPGPVRPAATLEAAETSTVETLPLPGPHWVFLVDMVGYELVASKVFVIDGAQRRFLGMISAGYLPNFAMQPDGSEMYLAETYHRRATRGQREDVVTIIDPRELAPKAEIALPPGRFLSPTKKYALALSTDGRYLYSFNMRPATSVSVVDVRERRYVRDIDLPGCMLALPYGPRAFASLCSNGALLDVRMTDEGADLRRGEPFFDPLGDPVFDQPAFSQRTRKAFFLSYAGYIHPVHFGAHGPSPRPRWTAVTDEERAADWRPGGFQPIAYSAALDRLYVLMHQGPRWSHKAPATEIWVLNASTGARVARVKLATPAASLIVTQDAKPLIFTTDRAGILSVYEAAGDYAHRGDMDQLGSYASVFHVTGE